MIKNDVNVNRSRTMKRNHHDIHNSLRSHLADVLNVYNFARCLKTLSGLTPYEYICKIWIVAPARFFQNPIQQIPGLNSSQIFITGFSRFCSDPGAHSDCDRANLLFGTVHPLRHHCRVNRWQKLWGYIRLLLDA